MKKKTIILLGLIITVTPIFSQNFTLENIKNKVANTLGISSVPVIGKWNYVRPACVFESENLLKKAGGAVVATQVENKFKEYFDKVGIKAGKSYFIFKDENTYSANLGLAKLSGKYSIDAENNNISLTSGMGIEKLNGKLVKSGNSMKIMFDADGFLKLMKFLSTFTKDNSIEILAAMDDLYDGMLLGFDLVKENPNK